MKLVDYPALEWRSFPFLRLPRVATGVDYHGGPKDSEGLKARNHVRQQGFVIEKETIKIARNSARVAPTKVTVLGGLQRHGTLACPAFSNYHADSFVLRRPD